MESTLNFIGGKSIFPASTSRAQSCQTLLSQQLHFASFIAGSAGLYTTDKRLPCRSIVSRVRCERNVLDVLDREVTECRNSVEDEKQLTCVMKFGGSSVASAERMMEVAALIRSFPKERPVIVLSAMGKTTNKLLLAGEKAVSCGVSNVSDIEDMKFIKELHLMTVDELDIDRSVITTHLNELEQLLKGIAMMKELTLRTTDYLVSFGECMSTRIFAAYLNKIGIKARQYDAFEIGIITTDDFTNADILEATYPAVAKRLLSDWISDPAIPIVTGFLGKGWRSCAVTTLGRGGSDLTATTIGKALGLQEIQVWKDVDGVLTCDPNIYSRAEPVPYLTFDEAAELAYFGAQDLTTKRIIGKGRESGGLYVFEGQPSKSVACSGVTSPFDAHCRLGHPSLSSLKKLCPQFHNVSSLNCESCQFAKLHRCHLSPRVNKRASAPFELVHSDVWSSCPVVSKFGFKYFVTFVDDYSRMTWLYLMKSRSELFSHFCTFHAEINTQFNVSTQ